MTNGKANCMITLVQDGISRKEIKTHRWIFQQNCLIGHKFFNPPFIVTILARPSICSVVSSILPLAIYRCRQYKQGLSRDQVRSKVGTEKIPPLTSQLIKHAIPPIVFSSVGSSSSLLLTHLIVSSLNEKYSALLHIHGTIFELLSRDGRGPTLGRGITLQGIQTQTPGCLLERSGKGQLLDCIWRTGPFFPRRRAYGVAEEIVSAKVSDRCKGRTYLSGRPNDQ